MFLLLSPDRALNLILAPICIAFLSPISSMPPDLLTCPNSTAVCQRTNKPVGLSKREIERERERGKVAN